MEKLFKPRSVAVIGVSRHRGKVGRIIFDNIKDHVKTYPVNVKAHKIEGYTVYTSILDIKENIDLAIISVPAKFVPQVLDEVGKKGVKYVIIISAGFSEVGDTNLVNETKAIIKKYGLYVVGPNSMGIISEGLNLTFTNFKVKKGSIAFISQSGALGSGLLDKLSQLHIGLSKFISIGNQMNLCVSDFIEYLDKDEDTKVIFVYVEGLKDGDRFFNVCKKAKTPIVILKGGRSKKGEKAAKSHTASISTDISVWKGVLNQLSIPLVDSVRELINTSIAIDRFGFVGKRGAVVTNAGGLGVLISDVIGDNLAKIDSKLIKELNGVLPDNWSHGNPIDIVGDADASRYISAIKKVIGSKKFDFIIVGFTPQAMSEPVKTAKALLQFDFPIFPVFLGGEEVSKAKEILRTKFVVVDDPTDLTFVRNIIK